MFIKNADSRESIESSDCALFSELKRIESNNASNEYYLTDAIELIKENFPVQTEKISNPAEVIGINTINQLSDLENNN